MLSAMPFNPGAAGLDVEPFPTVDVQVRLPAGKSGQADVTLTTPAGAETLSEAFQYAASVTLCIIPWTLFKPLPMTREERICISQQGTMWMFSR